jgi:hypothetical protein
MKMYMLARGPSVVVVEYGVVLSVVAVVVGNIY